MFRREGGQYGLSATGIKWSPNGRGTVASVSPRRTAVAQRRTQVGLAEQRKHAVRRQIFIPKPFATSRSDVIANLMAGLRQTNLRRVEGWEDLDAILEGQQLEVGSVQSVESVSQDLEYWLVTLRLRGQPFARALVGKSGWLLSIMRTHPLDLDPEPKSVEWAEATALDAGYAAAETRLIHMYNNLTETSGSADYYPFFEVSVAGRPPMFVAQDGSIFEVDSNGDGISFWKEGTRFLRRIR